MNVLVKGSIVEIDASPFVAWYEKHYGVFIGKKKVEKVAKAVVKGKGQKVQPKKGQKVQAQKAAVTETKKVTKKMSSHLKHKMAAREKARKLESALADEFQSGRLLARISSRPGQCGRADGYILEGPEYEFYNRKVGKKRSK